MKGHEEFSGDETREFEDTYGDEDDLSSSASSYKVGQYDDDEDDLSGLSDEEGSGLLLDLPVSTRTRSWERDRATRSRSRELSPIIDDEELSSSYGSRHRNRSGDSDEKKGNVGKRRGSVEKDSISSSHRQGDIDLDDEMSSKLRRQRKQRELEDEKDEEDLKVASRTGRKGSFDDTESKRRNRHKVGSDDELSGRWKSGSKDDIADEEPTVNTRKSKSKKPANDDDSDDADLEELLKKQKERMKFLRDEEEDYKPVVSSRKSNTAGSSTKLSDDDTSPKRVRKSDSSPVVSPRHEAKVNGTSKKGSDSREGSEEPSEGSHVSSKKDRRRRQRQRTIESLTSPEHQAAKSNGVK